VASGGRERRLLSLIARPTLRPAARGAGFGARAQGALGRPPYAAARYCFGLTPRTRLNAVLSANGLP
jgi:hypothetical protein